MNKSACVCWSCLYVCLCNALNIKDGIDQGIEHPV